ncbi:putative RNase toxin 44 of polymorphic toxin system, partial [Shewanella chilikensis]
YRFVVWSLMSLFTSLNDFTRLAWCPKLSGQITKCLGCPVYVSKKFGSSEDFGNFHYGAMLSAAGFEDSLIYSGASANQAWKDDGKGITGLWGLLSGFVTQDRDHAHDTVQVTRGINYYKEVYKNDNNTTNVSDSCDDSNGLQIVAATGIGGGGPGGSIDPGVPGGARVSYKYSCELWRFPNGLGGHCYINRNFKYKIIPY